MIRARHFPQHLTRHSYWLVVIIPLLMPLCWSLRDLPLMGWAFAWVPLLVLFVILPVLDLVIGRDLHNPEPARKKVYPDTIVPLATAVCYLVVLGWSLSVIGRFAEQFNWLSLLGWTLSLGDIGAVAGINIAHELIHRRKKVLQWTGGFLLAAVWYPGFKIEHPRWHHVHVATPADPSSAVTGSNIYRQVPRALVLNTIQAWKLAVNSARSKKRSMPFFNHEIGAWFGVSLLLTIAVAATWGYSVAAIFVLQGLVAASLLEIINFVEHYGLSRSRRANGKLEAPGIAHSWDSDYWLSNAILIQLPRHADHHTHPSRPFQALQRHEESPQLPFGYPMMVNIAFVPPLWRKIIHPHLPARQSKIV